jgi:hypothetical protein
MSGVATTGVELDPAAENLLDDIVATDEVRARLLRFLLLVGAGNGQHLLALAEAVRQDDRAAHHLVRVLRVHHEAHRDFDRLVELGVLHLLNQGNRLLDRVRTTLDLRSGCREFLRRVLPCFSSWSNRHASRASHSTPNFQLPTSKAPWELASWRWAFVGGVSDGRRFP